MTVPNNWTWKIRCCQVYQSRISWNFHCLQPFAFPISNLCDKNNSGSSKPTSRLVENILFRLLVQSTFRDSWSIFGTSSRLIQRQVSIALKRTKLLNQKLLAKTETPRLNNVLLSAQIASVIICRRFEKLKKESPKSFWDCLFEESFLSLYFASQTSFS